MRKKFEHIFIILFVIISVLFLLILAEHENNLIPISYKGMVIYNQNMVNENQLLYLNCNWICTDENGQEYLVHPDTLLAEKNKKPVTLSLYVSLDGPGQMYGIIVPQMNSDYELYINDKLIKANGSYCNKPQYTEYLDSHYFYTDLSRIKLTLKIKNISETVAFTDFFIFGTASAIKEKYLKTIIYDLICIVILVVASSYFCILSSNDWSHKEYFSFAMVCICYSVRILFINTNIIAMCFNCIPYYYETVVDRLTPPLLIALILFHVNNMIPGIVPKRILYSVASISIGAALLAFIPNDTAILACYYVCICMAVTTTVTVLVCSIAAIINGNHSGKFILLYTILFVYSFILDQIPVHAGTIYSYSLSISIIFFIFGQAVTFLDRSGALYKYEITLSKSYNETISNLRTEETNYLSSHLKPHFLFNALNIISGYALFEPDIAKKVTEALIIYLKQLFEHDNLNEMNSLENEIALVEAFGYIECQRFPDITIEYDMDYHTKNFMIPALILQPLLENAVNHGIRKQKKAIGVVVISIVEQDNYMNFTITDDGLGMDLPEKINALSKPEDNKFHSLYHLQLRLKELYKEKLIVTTEPGNGTEIFFKIPVKTK